MSTPNNSPVWRFALQDEFIGETHPIRGLDWQAQDAICGLSSAFFFGWGVDCLSICG